MNTKKLLNSFKFEIKNNIIELDSGKYLLKDFNMKDIIDEVKYHYNIISNGVDENSEYYQTYLKEYEADVKYDNEYMFEISLSIDNNTASENEKQLYAEYEKLIEEEAYERIKGKYINVFVINGYRRLKFLLEHNCPENMIKAELYYLTRNLIVNKYAISKQD